MLELDLYIIIGFDFLTFLSFTSSLALLTISCSSLADMPAVFGLLVAPRPLMLLLDVVVLNLIVVIIVTFNRHFDQIVDRFCTLESCSGVMRCLGRNCSDSHKTELLIRINRHEG